MESRIERLVGILVLFSLEKVWQLLKGLVEHVEAKHDVALACRRGHHTCGTVRRKG